MLNIPAEIQALYKTDGIRKNFRVHFPNGENPDLTNSDIVAGSVSFTESVCSKDVLQFGLAEASRIQFECVGVPNVYGAMIECFCEIDTSSLSSEYQTQMNDLDYPVYQIPYGRFEIRSCPRNADGMWKRRVEAYTYGGSNLRPSQYITDLINFPTVVEPLAFNPICYLMSATNSDLGLTLRRGQSIGLITSARINAPSVSWSYDGHTYTVTNTNNSKYTRYAIIAGRVTKMTCDSVIASDYSDLFEYMESHGATNEALKNIRLRVLPGYDLVYVGNRYLGTFADPSESQYDSGYICTATNSDTYVYVPGSMTVDVKEDGSTIQTFNLSGFLTNADVFEMTLDDTSLASMYVSFTPSFKQESPPANYMYIGAVDYPSMYEGFLELNGYYGRNGRDGKIDAIHLSKSSPVSMLPDEYSDMWWDEYDISPIGSIKLTYYDINAKQEQTMIYQFGDGLSEYDMTNNFLLKHLGVSSSDLQGYVTSLVDSLFIPNIADIAFTPVDLDALGLPYLEAGDYLEVSAKDGTVVGTYILSRSLSGEQYLEDSIESQGGEIIGNVRSA